eukprot:symbB.v1.2.038658.t1/scaffold6103.1/size20916/3
MFALCLQLFHDNGRDWLCGMLCTARSRFQIGFKLRFRLRKPQELNHAILGAEEVHYILLDLRWCIPISLMLFAEDEYEEREFKINLPDGVKIPALGEQRQLSVKLYGWPMGLSGAITWRGVWAALPALLHRADSLQSSNVLELGAGCGLLANTAAVLGAHSIATDGNEEELPLLQKNALAFVDGMSMGGSLSACHLEWGEAAAERSGLRPKSFNFIIGSEIVYIPECIPALVESLCFFLADNGEALIANTAVATRTDQSAARVILCQSLEAKGLDFQLEMPPQAPPPPGESSWAETSYILYVQNNPKIENSFPNTISIRSNY